MALRLRTFRKSWVRAKKRTAPSRPHQKTSARARMSFGFMAYRCVWLMMVLISLPESHLICIAHFKAGQINRLQIKIQSTGLQNKKTRTRHTICMDSQLAGRI